VEISITNAAWFTNIYIYVYVSVGIINEICFIIIYMYIY
jgi:hypothetical protein